MAMDVILVPLAEVLICIRMSNSPSFLAGYLKQLIDYIKNLGYGELATIVGRYYAMDRDTRWERTRVAYDAMVANVGEDCTVDKAIDAVKQRYAKDQTDEFLEPLVFGQDSRVKGLYFIFENFLRI